MQSLGMMAIGFVFGVLVTVLFGHRIAVMVAADAKAVAYDAGRVVSDARNGIRASMSSMEVRLHAKLDAIKDGTKNNIIGRGVGDAVNVGSGGCRGTVAAPEKKLESPVA